MAPKVTEYQTQTTPAGPFQTRAAKQEDTGNVGASLQQLGTQAINTGSLIERRQGQAEVSDIAAKLAQAHADGTNDLDNTLKTATPGDKDVAHNFLQKQSDSIDEIGEGIQTRAGREYFQRASAELKSHFQVAAVTGQSNLAAVKVKQDFETSVNNLSSSLITDPSSQENSFKMLSMQMDGLVSSGALPANKRAELEQMGQKELAKSAMKGWIQIDPSVAKTKLDSGQYDSYFNGDVKSQLYGEIKTANNANRIEEERAQKARDDADKRAQEATKTSFVAKMQEGTLSAKDIIKSNLSAESQEHYLNALDKANREELKPDPATVIDTFERIHAPEGDPRKITDESQIDALFSQLGYTGIKQARDELAGRKTERGKMETAVQKSFLDNAKGQLVKSGIGISDPDGQARYSAFLLNSFYPQLQAGKKAGKTINEMFDQNSPDYVGKDLMKYKGSPQDILKSITQRMNPNPSPSVAPSTTTGAAPGTVAAPALKIGDIQNGYQYKGGAPHDQSSWKKVE